MRIAVVATSYPRSDADPGGHFVRTEVLALTRAGHEVLVFAPGAPDRSHSGNPALHWLGAADAFGWPGLLERLKRAPWRAPSLGMFLLRARRALAHADYDELVLHWLLPVAPWLLPERERPTTVVVHGSDARLLLALPNAAVTLVLQRLRARRVRLRCVSEELRRELVGRCPGLAERCYVQPAAIDVPFISHDGLRERLGLRGDAFVAVVVGRLIESKRVDVALERAAVPQGTVWVVVGDGPLLDELRARFGQVRFVGAVPRQRALEWIAASDVLVSASLHEGAPTAIREARALGTRVWTAAVGDVPAWASVDCGISIRPELQ